MSELPEGLEPAPLPEPIDSALGIVVRRRGDALDVLLGRRSRASRFMPNHLVFPGGKLDAVDDKERSGAFERCVSREVREETGLDIAPDAWRAAGERTTPPLFPVRFRTLFFVAELGDDARLPDAPPAPEEIETLSFADPRDVLADWASGKALVPPPLHPILRLLADSGASDAASLATRIAAINAEQERTPRIEFTPGFWVFPVRTRTLPPASCTNVWMPGGRRFLVIDPGSESDAENARLLDVIAKRSLSGDRVLAVVLTHHHRDHVAGAGAIAAALGVPVLAHPETLLRIPALPGGVATRPLADGDTIDLSGMTLRVVHTPGHAPGHLALFEANRRVLIAGDLVSGLSTILVGLTDGDMDAYLRSLQAVASLDPKIVLPSHGPPLPGKSLSATRAHREAREARILDVLADGLAHPLAAIASQAYAETPQVPAVLRELQTLSHLARLIRRGLAEASAHDGYRKARAT